jgi:uncharacterized membrane protein
MEYTDETIASLASLIGFHNELEQRATVNILEQPIRKVYRMVTNQEMLGIVPYFATRYTLSSHQRQSYLNNIPQTIIFN